jgi:polysaccharide biosynthesis protein PslG
VLAVSLFAPSTAAAARSEFFGIVQGPTLDSQDLEGLAGARVHTDRFVLTWGWVEPNQGSFRWGSMDNFVGRLARHGIRLVPSVWGNPDWVAGSSSTPPISGPQGVTAWRNFLKAAVARYGRGGSYWTTGYRQKYGAGATPLPIQSWQIWNEPNLKGFFAPQPSPGQYARLLAISHDAIRSQDPQARIVLAGMPRHGDISAWDFLKKLYAVGPAVKSNFDVVALHPYAPHLYQVREAIEKIRTVMRNHADQATPLWITEIAWGSAPPDGGLNKGLTGQASMLYRAYELIVGHRDGWNVRRLFWYHWRDPGQVEAHCSFCGSAGLLRHDRTHKPALVPFRHFTLAG